MNELADLFPPFLYLFVFAVLVIAVTTFWVWWSERDPWPYTFDQPFNMDKADQ